MSSRAASPRALVFAAVVAAHAGALLLLLAETRSRLVRGEAEAGPLLVMLFQPREHQTSATSAGPAAHPPTSRYRPAAAAEPQAPAPVIPAAPGAVIDWAAEASAATARQVETDERRARQARALAKPNPMFARAPRRAPGIPWDYAATHRVEPLGGLTTAIHLNDQCAVVLFLIIPFAGGCALEKPKVRGDLFEHMHDPDPAPER